MKDQIASYFNGNVLRRCTESLVFLLPACAVVLNHGASYPHGILALMALVCLPFFSGKQTLTKDEKTLLILVVCFSLWPAVSWLIADASSLGFKRLGVYVRCLMFIPVYFLIRRLNLSIDSLLLGLIVGAVGAGVYAIAEIWFGIESLYPERASGATNPVFFGNLSLLMGVMAFSFWPVCKHRRCYVLLVAALILGLIASMLSGSRGGWLAVPLLLTFLLWQIWNHINVKQRLLVLMLFIVIPAGLYLSPETGVAERIQSMQSDTDAYQQGVFSSSSLGIRFEVWHGAVEMFLNNPFTGIGLGNFITELEILRGEEIPESHVHFYMHAHNEYLHTLAVSGVVGVVAVVSLLFFPAYLFYKQIKSDDDEIRALSYAGISMIIGYAAFSFTDVCLSRSIYISFYTCCLFFIMASISLKTVKNNNENQIT